MLLNVFEKRFLKTHKSVYYLSQKCVIYVFFFKHLLFSVCLSVCVSALPEEFLL